MKTITEMRPGLIGEIISRADRREARIDRRMRKLRSAMRAVGILPRLVLMRRGDGAVYVVEQ